MVVQGKFRQDSLSLTGKRQENFAAIVVGSFAADALVGLEAVNQLDRAVMLQLHPVGEFSDSWPDAVGNPLNCQHQLVLLLFDARLAYRLLAEVQELANLVAELGQGLVVRLAECSHL